MQMPSREKNTFKARHATNELVKPDGETLNKCNSSAETTSNTNMTEPLNEFPRGSLVLNVQWDGVCAVSLAMALDPLQSHSDIGKLCDGEYEQ